MKKTPTGGFHRRLFAEAWSLVRTRKTLWVFGIFSGLALSGAVIEPAFSGLSRAARLGDFWMRLQLDDWARAAAPAGTAIAQACRINPLVSQIGVTFAIMVALGLIMWMFISEGALLSGLTEKTPSSRAVLARRGWHEACGLFVLNAIGRAYQLVLLLLLTLPILFYLEAGGFTRTFAAMLAILLFVPLSIAGHSITALASIHAVRKDADVPSSLETGLRTFCRHWLAAVETGVLLMLASGVAILGFGVAATIIGIPIALVFAVAHYSGQLIGVAAVAAVAILAFCALLFAFTGFLTAFRCAVWVRFYERVSHPLTGPRVIARLKRWFHPKHVR